MTISNQNSDASSIPEDFRSLLPKVAKDARPFKYLFVWDPDKDEVHLEPEDLGDTEVKMHHLMAEHVHHEDRVDGYAYAIDKGWRIVSDEHGELDPYVKERVKQALKGEHAPVPLPTIRYHGDPRR
jgi:hypothetical protein